MEFQLPLDTIFTQAFGLASPNIRRFNLTTEQTAEMQGLEDDEDLEVTSMLGTPVQFWMKFLKGKYKKQNLGKIVEDDLPGMFLPFTSVASFSREKRVTESYMPFFQGEVIEDYGFESWNIDVKGLILKGDKILESGKNTVDDQLKELKKYEVLSDSIFVSGKMFELLKIHEVRIKSINFPELKNWNPKVVMPYEMNLKSVHPIQLISLD